MISCTEFIPAYSELFTYLDDHYGRKEVERFWAYLFEPTGDGIPLINFAKKMGLRGCWEYWKGTLTEEAADCTKYMNEKEGWIFSEMHYCPSKGRLLELEKEIGLKPYYDYCGHCDYYRASLEKVGLTWTRNHLHVDRASCESLIIDPTKFKGMVVPDENMEILDIKPSEHEYFHRDFHSSLNMGIDFLAREHGEEALRDFLRIYTAHVYFPVLEKDGVTGMDAIERQIRKTYTLEHAEDAVEINNDGTGLTVKIGYCPAVRHLHDTGRVVSDWFGLSTEEVMATLAAREGLKFTMVSYDAATGAAEYRFEK
ncbi:MAG: hypothetical protein MJ099_03770 [Clostridia bacterium]|nr:hypothetical protein [Clostridia bacterium]